MPSRPRPQVPQDPVTASAPAPERWAVKAGDAASANLTIPADARRQRQFEIACAVTVAVPEASSTAPAWLQVTVQANGLQQWRRRIASGNVGAWDGLDYRFRAQVPVGHTLRVTVTSAGQGVRRRSLDIEADEV